MSIYERKRSLEKAKVAQMTRHLMMRMSYARLKVDHGWQKQNLSEVENLYFHHYRQSRPARPLSPLPPPLASTYLNEHDDTPRPTKSPPNAHEDHEIIPYPQLESVSQAPTHPSAATPTNPPALLPAPPELISDNENSRTLTSAQHQAPVSPPLSPIARPSSYPNVPRTPVRSPPSENMTTPLAKPFSPISRQTGTGTILHTPSSSGSPIGMTYDSFWSSLSTNSQPTYKNALASAAQITGLSIGVPKGSSTATSLPLVGLGQVSRPEGR